MPTNPIHRVANPNQQEVMWSLFEERVINLGADIRNDNAEQPDFFAPVPGYIRSRRTPINAPTAQRVLIICYLLATHIEEVKKYATALVAIRHPREHIFPMVLVEFCDFYSVLPKELDQVNAAFQAWLSHFPTDSF